MTFAELQKLDARVRLERRTTRPPACRQGDLNVNEPKFMQEFDTPAARDVARRLADVSAAGACSTPRRRRCPTISSRRSSRSAAQFLNGAREMKPRWKRCVGVDRRAARRGARPQVRREVFPARGEGAHAGAGEEPAPRDEGDDRRARVDERRRPRRARSRSSRRSIPRSAIRTSGRITARSPCAATRTGNRCSRRAASACRTITRTIDKPVDRGRWGLTPPTSDAYYNPTAERDRLPGGHPAAAGLQHAGASTPSTTARSAS